MRMSSLILQVFGHKLKYWAYYTFELMMGFDDQSGDLNSVVAATFQSQKFTKVSRIPYLDCIYYGTKDIFSPKVFQPGPAVISISSKTIYLVWLKGLRTAVIKFLLKIHIFQDCKHICFASKGYPLCKNAKAEIQTQGDLYQCSGKGVHD